MRAVPLRCVQEITGRYFLHALKLVTYTQCEGYIHHWKAQFSNAYHSAIETAKSTRFVFYSNK